MRSGVKYRAMRIGFSDAASIRARAKAGMLTQSAVIRRYFGNKYSLPCTHPTFLAQSEAEWLEEMYADLYAEHRQAVDALGQLDSLIMDPKAQQQERTRLMNAIKRLSKTLDEATPEIVTDPLLDSYDAKLQAGEDVDLQALLPKNWKPPKG